MMAGRLKALHDHLERESKAVAQPEEFNRLRAGRPSDIAGFDQLVVEAQAECVAASLQSDQYGRTLDPAAALYRRMANCRANPTPTPGNLAFYGESEAHGEARKEARRAIADACVGCDGLHRELERLVKEVEIRHRVLAEQSKAGGKPIAGDESRGQSRPSKKTAGHPGNPTNRWTRKQKAEARRHLAAWKKARATKTMPEFLKDYPEADRAKIRAMIRTAMKWESEKKRKNADRR
jgi:hypothetical protein